MQISAKSRVSKEAFEYALGKIRKESTGYGTRKTYIPIRLALTLELLGSGNYQWLVGSDFYLSVAQSIISVIV